jgi:hypothetical protein
VCPPADILNAPGLAFSTLLKSAKASSLRQLVGPGIIETLEGLDPTLISEAASGNSPLL